MTTEPTQRTSAHLRTERAVNDQMKNELGQLSDTFDSKPTFFMWIVDNLSKDEMMVLREHGAKSSIFGMASESVSVGIYDRYADIEDLAFSKGFLRMPRDKNAVGLDQLKIALLWVRNV